MYLHLLYLFYVDGIFANTLAYISVDILNASLQTVSVNKLCIVVLFIYFLLRTRRNGDKSKKGIRELFSRDIKEKIQPSQFFLSFASSSYRYEIICLCDVYIVTPLYNIGFMISLFFLFKIITM